MTRLPHKTAAPDPASLFSPPASAAAATMSSTTASPAATTTAEPVPTPLPAGASVEDTHDEACAQEGDVDEVGKGFDLPKLRLVVEDLGHPGASRFLKAVNGTSCLTKGVKAVLHHLYKTHPKSVPGTRSVTLYLEDMDGVAYTTGSSLDNDHKEIHFSLRYIKNMKKAPEGAEGDITGAYEIAGVLVHELVHCFQHNGRDTCPSGLIEGIADWVRLRAHLGAAHWKRGTLPDRWDQGYEKTAYFLDWLEAKCGAGAVVRINEKLRDEEYVEKSFWLDLFDVPLPKLWKEYTQTLKHEH